VKPKWLVMCVTASLLLLAAVGLVQGFDASTWLLVALLAVCPLVLLWAMRRTPPASRDEAHR
jgi:hypothetical protein